MSAEMTTIETLEQQLKAATETAKKARQAALEAQQAEQEVSEIRAQISSEKRQQVYQAAMQKIEAVFVSLQESGDRINDLSEALKDELKQFEQLSSEASNEVQSANNSQPAIIPQVVYSSYAVENLPAAFWAENVSVTGIYLVNRGAARNDYFHKNNSPNSPYGQRLETMANLD